MRILLLGDYSGVHSELRNALKKKGFDVKLISDGDGYKGFPADVIINNGPMVKGKIGAALYSITELLGTTGILTFIRKWGKLKKEMVDYDVVQLINPIAFTKFGSIVNLFALRYIKKHNGKIFLCAIGDDYAYVKHNMTKETKSIPYKNVNLFNFYKNVYSLRYVYGFLYKTLDKYAIKISEKIIPGLYDYQRVYSIEKSTKLIPLPVAPEKIGKSIKIDEKDKIIIFHGWQTGKERVKGNFIFDNAAKRICANYPEKVEYQIVQNVPYKEYIKLFNKAHIALDQCFSYDKGMNGLFLMAAGKVVFSGFEKKTLQNYPFYDADKIYGINAKADEKYLYDKLVSLIENPKLIEEISQNAIEFVSRNHSNDFVADLYLNIWKSNERTFA